MTAIPDLVVHEGFYHPAFQRHPANPVVRLQAHGFTPPEKMVFTAEGAKDAKR
jgi:hypothetical protein